MTTIILTGDVDATSGTAYTVVSGTDLFVADGADIRARGPGGVGIASPHNDVEMMIDGRVFGTASGLRTTDEDGELALTVGQAGRITSFGGTVLMDNEVMSLTNHGEIRADGARDRFPNDAVRLIQNDSRDYSTVLNTGLISAATGTALRFIGEVPGQPVDAFIVNTGTMVGAAGILADGSAVVINNSGLISAAPGPAVKAARAQIQMTLTNSGVIAGDVDLSDSGDRYLGSGDGLVTGTVDGFGGDDVLRGTPADDRFSGGGDDDTLLGGAGDDSLDGGEGEDVVRGGAGDDRVDGGVGADRLNGGAGDDSVDGGTQADTIHGGTGDDSVDGAAGDDLVFGGRGDDSLDGGADEDVIGGGAGDDTVAGGDGDDRLFGGTGNDSLNGQRGADAINAGVGDDTVAGNNQDDTIRGQGGDDSLDGGSGQDTVRGGEGHDTIEGGIFGDLLGGGAGNDFIDGEGGDDTIHGGAGDDEITTGDGADDIVIRKGMGQDLVTDFTDGLDQVDVRALNLQNFGDLQSKYTVIEHQNAVFLDFGDGDTLMLDGVSLPQLAYGDFVWF